MKTSTQPATGEESFDGHQKDANLGKIMQVINHKLSFGINNTQIFEFIFEALNFIIPYDRIGIALLENENKRARLVWVRSKGSVQQLKQNYSAALSGSSLENIIQTGKPRIIGDLRLYFADHPQSESTALALKDGIISSLTCPLNANNKPIGFVFFSSYHPNTYQDQHIQTFLAIADALSIVVEQAELKKSFDEGKARERSISQIIHDLRAPLAVIKDCLYLAKVEGWLHLLPSSALELFDILDRAAQDMFIMLEELVELKELGDPNRRAVLNPVSLIGFCNEISETGKILGKRKQIIFETSIDEQLPKLINFDRNLVRRVLDNLITNAIKFSQPGTRVQFAVKSNAERVIFSIEDQGQGIQENELGNLFTEFGKTSTLPTMGETSTGLGLAIAKEIVERHGGQISVVSQVGKGSTFSFWIPLNSSLH